jgi:hypothetical protein
MIQQKSNIKKNVHWKEYIKNQYFQLEFWRWNGLVIMLEGIIDALPTPWGTQMWVSN